jgi:hypothetical protein
VYNGREDPEQIFQFEISCTDYSAMGVYSGLPPIVHCHGWSSMAIAIAVVSQHAPMRLAAYPIVLRQASRPSQPRVARCVSSCKYIIMSLATCLKRSEFPFSSLKPLITPI